MAGRREGGGALDPKPFLLRPRRCANPDLAATLGLPLTGWLFAPRHCAEPRGWGEAETSLTHPCLTPGEAAVPSSGSSFVKTAHPGAEANRALPGLLSPTSSRPRGAQAHPPGQMASVDTPGHRVTAHEGLQLPPGIDPASLPVSASLTPCPTRPPRQAASVWVLTCPLGWHALPNSDGQVPCVPNSRQEVAQIACLSGCGRPGPGPRCNLSRRGLGAAVFC